MLVPVPRYASALIRTALEELERAYNRVMPIDWDQRSNPELVPDMKWNHEMNRPPEREEKEGPNMEFRGIKLWFSRAPGSNTRTNNPEITPAEWAEWFEVLSTELKRQEEKRILQLPLKNTAGVG